MSCLIRYSVVWRGLLFFNIFILIKSSRSTAQRNFSQCSKNYCYFWSGKTSSYEELEPCPEQYWDLEIYGQRVQKDVMEFIKYLDRNGSSSIVGCHIPLNLFCKNATWCVWKHTNRVAKHFNWDFHIDWKKHEPNTIYYFRANTSNGTNKWHRIQEEASNYTFAKFCMRSNGSSETSGKTSEQQISIALAVVGIIFIALIGVVVVLVVLRKRLRSESVENKIAQQRSNESGKPIYAEVPKGAEEDNSNQRQSSIQYADLNWSTNISKVEENESKPVEDQRRNYFGPMGDVYARIQKG